MSEQSQQTQTDSTESPQDGSSWKAEDWASQKFTVAEILTAFGPSVQVSVLLATSNHPIPQRIGETLVDLFDEAMEVLGVPDDGPEAFFDLAESLWDQVEQERTRDGSASES